MSKSRDELRRELRKKIKDKRNPSNSTQSLAKNVKQDPQTALMSMGVDDPDILNNAKVLLKDPKSMLKTLTDQLVEESRATRVSESKAENGTSQVVKQYKEKHDEEEDEEGLPPMLI